MHGYCTYSSLFLFRLTRLFWSTVDPNKRCIYTCTIKEIDQPVMSYKPQTPSNKIAENHTVTCHENEIDIFKSAGLDNHLGPSKQLDKKIISPGSSNTQDVLNRSDSQEKHVKNDSCPCVNNVETNKKIRRIVTPSRSIPSSPVVNMPSTKQKLTIVGPPNSHVSTIPLSEPANIEQNSSLRTQNVCSPRISSATSQQTPGTLHVNMLGSTHSQASLRASTPNLQRTLLSRAPNSTKSDVSSSTSVLMKPTMSSSPFPRTSNVRNISPMDLLIDLTKPKPKTTVGYFPQSVKFTANPQQSNVGLGQVKAKAGISSKRSKQSNPHATISSQMNTVRTVRTTPIPLAPKPTPYTPVTFIEHYPNSGPNYKRLIPKSITAMEPKGSTNPSRPITVKTATATPLIFHSTEFVSQGSNSKVVEIKKRIIASSPSCSSSQVHNRPSHITQNHSQILTPSPRSVVPVTKKIVQLHQVVPQPKLKESPSNVVKLSTNLSQQEAKPKEVKSKIVQLNADPAQLAANFLRLRAKTTQGGSKTVSLMSSQSNSPHHKTASSISPSFQRVATATPTQHSSCASSRTSTSINTSPKVSQKSSSGNVTQTQTTSQTLASVVAASNANDSDGMAVVVGSPEQITKLLSENPNMIELLGSQSTDYLGKLLTSHSNSESRVRQRNETRIGNEQQNSCVGIKDSLERPTVSMIDLTKPTSKHVIDLTKDDKIFVKSTVSSNPKSTSISRNLSTTLNSISSSLTSTSVARCLSSAIVQNSLTSTSLSISRNVTSTSSSISRNATSTFSSSSVTPSSSVSRSPAITLSSGSLTSSSVSRSPATTLAPSNPLLTPTSSVKINKFDLNKGRNAVRKLDRSCLNISAGAKVQQKQGIEAISLGKPVQSGIKSPTVSVHPTSHTSTTPQYIFHNRRFLHASLDTPSLEKKANRVSPLSSPAKIMANIEDQSKNIEPVVSESRQGMEYCQKLQASTQQRKEDNALNNAETGTISKKDVVKGRGKRTYTKRTYTKRKELDEDSNNQTKKIDTRISTKRKNDENSLVKVKRTKIDEDDIVLPDFARVKQSDLRSKRLEKVNQELNVMFVITSEEGLEVTARTCEGMHEILHFRNSLPLLKTGKLSF